MLRFAANLHFLFTEVPFLRPSRTAPLDRFAAAARAGFRAVEFPDPYSSATPEIAERLRAETLDCALLNFPMGDRSRGELGIACLPDRRVEFRDSVALGIDTAAALGCRQLNCMAGFAPVGLEPAELRATLIENLRYACRESARARLGVLIEPLNIVDRPGLFLARWAQALDIVRAVGADNLRIQLDCYHLWMMGDDPLSLLDEHLPLIGHIQIADAPGRHEPGSGQLPYHEIFRLLGRRGYAGWIGAEYHPAGRTEQGLGWLSTMP